MKKTIRKKAIGITFCFLLLAACCLFFACKAPFLEHEEGTGSVSIFVGGGSPAARSVSRSAISGGYPPQDAGGTSGTGPALADLRYRFFFNGTEKTGGVEAGGSIQFTVPAGTYTVRVEAYEPDNTGPQVVWPLYATGTAANVVVQAGQTTPVPIQMREAVTVTFRANGDSVNGPFFAGGSSNTVDRVDVQIGWGDTIRAGIVPRAAPNSGFVIEGWYTEAACTNKWNFSTAVTQDTITLYAKWAILFNVANETDWNSAKTAISGGGNNQSYVINVTAPITVTPTYLAVTGLNVTIKGNHTITLSGQGSLLTVNNGQTFILEDVDLKGLGIVFLNYDCSLMWINSGGSLTMQGSASVSNNESMVIDRSSMSTYSPDQYWGGGVVVDASATFIMKGNARVYGNKSTWGGGVLSRGTFIMQDNASVSGNFAGEENASNYYPGYGGGVYNAGTFIMEGGTISGNTSYAEGNPLSGGGGVYARGGIFTMKGGTISGNTAPRGGGIYVYSGNFRMAGGTVYGSDGSPNANTATTATTATLLIGTGTAATYGPNDGMGTNILPHPVGETSTSNTDTTIRVVNGVKQ